MPCRDAGNVGTSHDFDKERCRTETESRTGIQKDVVLDWDVAAVDSSRMINTFGSLRGYALRDVQAAGAVVADAAPRLPWMLYDWSTETMTSMIL